MRYSADQKARTRALILNIATGILCREGPDAVTLHRVMRDAGLSHGGFYNHFESREALLDAAVEASVARTLAALSQAPDANATGMREIVARYLGRAHLESEAGCPLPALCGHAVDEPVAVSRRAAITRYRNLIASRLPEDGPANAVLALMIGGIALARAVGGEDGEAILRDCRQAARSLE